MTRMPYYLVQPWGRDRYRQASVTSIHDTVDGRLRPPGRDRREARTRRRAPRLPGAERGGR